MLNGNRFISLMSRGASDGSIVVTTGRDLKNGILHKQKQFPFPFRPKISTCHTAVTQQPQGQKSFWCIIEVLFLYTISRHFRGQHSSFLHHRHNDHFMQHTLTAPSGPHTRTPSIYYMLYAYLYIYTTSIPLTISQMKIFVDVSLQNIQP